MTPVKTFLIAVSCSMILFGAVAAHAKLDFCNSSPEQVWVAYMFWSPDDCGGYGDWQTIGWFAIAPGACETVYANDLDDVNNRYWYFYAESASAVWAGPVRVYVTDAPFDSCLGIGSTAARIVGFRQIDVGDRVWFASHDHTVTLTP